MRHLGGRFATALAAVGVVALSACSPAPAHRLDPPPSTVDQSLEQARATLRRWCPTVTVQLVPDAVPPTADAANLVVTTQEYVAPSTEEKSCAAGVPQLVRLTVATTVPKLSGMTVGQARVAAARSGLVFTAPDNAPLDAVVQDQQPASGSRRTLDKIIRVDVTAAVTVPDVTREVEGEACADLQRAALTCALVTGGNAPPPGLVLAQEPAAGALVAPDTTVTLQVLRLESRTPVPNVVGLAEESACAPLEAVKLGCDLRVTVPGGPPGQVVGQAPPAGATVPSGSRVAVQVQRTPEQVRVPDLAGSTEDGVCERLYAAKLTCAPTVGGGGVAPGRVVGQRPAADSLVPVDSLVSVQIRREPGVRVPDVVGRSDQEALRILGRAGLASLVHGADGGRVLSQDPPAGTLVPRVSSVDLLLAGPAPGLPWWLYAIAAAVVVVIAALVARQTYRRRRARRHSGPRVGVEFHTGPALARADEAREW
jgi:beta-lactam-binding protein with PASTA domain